MLHLARSSADRAPRTPSNAVSVPTSRELDRRLVAGAAVFGIGWGIAGVCPGPAFVVLGAGRVEGVVFVAAMLVGMLAFELLERRRVQASAAAPS